MTDGAGRLPPGMTLVKVFDDPTPKGLVVGRVLRPFMMFSQFTDMTDQEGQRFLQSLNLTCRKLGSVWSHMDRFRKAQAASVQDMRKEKERQPHVFLVDQSQTLFIEFDEFVVQVKSTLDYLAQIPVPLLGANRWKLNTFGGRGRRVLQALKGCAPEKYDGQVSVIERHLFGDHQKWLDMTIEARDRITHYQRGGVPPEAFGVYVDTDNSVRLPEWSTDQTVEQFMEVVWQALVFYVEDFVALFLSLRLRPGTVFVRKNFDPVSPDTPWLAMPHQVADEHAKGGLRSPPYVPPSNS